MTVLRAAEDHDKPKDVKTKQRAVMPTQLLPKRVQE